MEYVPKGRTEWSSPQAGGKIKQNKIIKKKKKANHSRSKLYNVYDVTMVRGIQS